MNRTGPSPGGPPESGWRGVDFLRAAVILAAVYAGLQLLWLAHAIFFLVFLGVLLGLALASGVDRLKRWGVPRGVGAASIVAGLLGLLFLAGVLAAPTVRDQGAKLRAEVPQAIDELGRWVDERGPGVLRSLPAIDPDGDDGEEEPDQQGTEEAEEQDEDETTADAIRSRLADEMGTVAEHLFSFLTSTTAVLGGVLFTLFIAIYLAVSADTYRRGLLLLVPTSKQSVADEVMGETATMLRRWLSTQLVAMVVVGFCTTVILLLLDVPAALALGILAGLMEFVPILGPIIAAIPAIAMAFLVSPQTALYVLIAYVVLQQLESQLLVPMLMEKGVDLPPLLTVVIQALMALVFGFIGLLVAVPLLATVMVAVKILYLREVLGREVHLPSDASLST